MATRNLYERDGVAAALLYALANADTRTATSAAKELVDSEEGEYLFKLLTLNWLLSDPDHPHRKSRYDAFVAQDTKALFISMLDSPYNLPELGKPSGLAPPQPGRKLPPVSWTHHPTDWTPHMAGALWWAVAEALRKKHHARAAYLTIPLLSSNILSAAELLESQGVAKSLTELLKTTVYAPLVERILRHAYAGICGSAAAIPFSREAERIWNGSQTTRSFSVSAEALAAWHVRPKPVARLMGAPLLVADEDATIYWISACKADDVRATKEELLFPSDDACEHFYATHFPRDIPDEWSDKERAKSHGQHMLQTATKNPWQTAFILCGA